VRVPADATHQVDDLSDHPLPWSPEEFSVVSAALWERRSCQVDVGSSSRKEQHL
jgi:hypothetical protein